MFILFIVIELDTYYFIYDIIYKLKILGQMQDAKKPNRKVKNLKSESK